MYVMTAIFKQGAVSLCMSEQAPSINSSVKRPLVVTFSYAVKKVLSSLITLILA